MAKISFVDCARRESGPGFVLLLLPHDFRGSFEKQVIIHDNLDFGVRVPLFLCLVWKISPEKTQSNTILAQLGDLGILMGVGLVAFQKLKNPHASIFFHDK